MEEKPTSSAHEQGYWHSRGYLPHFDRPGLIQSVTFRLFDSIPAGQLQALDERLRLFPDLDKKLQRRRTLERLLDAGYGSCYLKNPKVATVVEQALLRFDTRRYRLLRWVIMPNHVHTLIEVIETRVSQIVHSWKSFTAKKINQILNRKGRFWMPDYFDRYIRDEDHFAAVVRYIDQNPVKAGLVRRPEEWRFSSAFYQNEQPRKRLTE